jgi:hypothetical protein
LKPCRSKTSSCFTIRVSSVAPIPLHDAIEEYVAIRRRKRVTEKKVTEIVDELLKAREVETDFRVSQIRVILMEACANQRVNSRFASWTNRAELRSLSVRICPKSISCAGNAPKESVNSSLARAKIIRKDQNGPRNAALSPQIKLAGARRFAASSALP